MGGKHRWREDGRTGEVWRRQQGKRLGHFNLPIVVTDGTISSGGNGIRWLLLMHWVNEALRVKRNTLQT